MTRLIRITDRFGDRVCIRVNGGEIGTGDVVKVVALKLSTKRRVALSTGNSSRGTTVRDVRRCLDGRWSIKARRSTRGNEFLQV